MPNRLLGATALSLALLLTIPLTANAEPRAAFGPDQQTTASPRSARAQAETALDRAKALFTKSPSARSRAQTSPPPAGRDATMVLRDLAVRMSSLSASDQKTAHAILARPTNGDQPGGFEHAYRSTSSPQHSCNADFCVHWIDPMTDSTDAADPDRVHRAPTGDTAAIPVWVQTNIDVIQHVWDTEVTDYGYQKPLSDASSTPDPGINPVDVPKLDIYLEQLGDKGLFGYCTTDDPASGRKLSAYCVLDNDFARSEFHADPTESLEVTAAHEFFHAVQFGYDIGEDTWFMEGTAAWMEDEVYDAVNDNFRYLRYSALKHPGIPLDFTRGSYLPYGSWVYWKFLSDSAKPGRKASDPTIVKQVWNKAKLPGVYSTKAVKKVLASRGTTFAKSFRRFGVWNRTPGKFYSEGGTYPKAPLGKSLHLKKSKRSTAVWGASLPHMSNGFIRYTAAKSLKGRWRLRVRLDMPNLSHGSGAALTVHLKNGNILVHNVKLSARGNASPVVKFSRSSVRFVELSLTNASTRFNCNRGTVLSCGGVPKDDNFKAMFQAKAIR